MLLEFMLACQSLKNRHLRKRILSFVLLLCLYGVFSSTFLLVKSLIYCSGKSMWIELPKHPNY
jgi:hypothetical protein